MLSCPVCTIGCLELNSLIIMSLLLISSEPLSFTRNHLKFHFTKWLYKCAFNEPCVEAMASHCFKTCSKYRHYPAACLRACLLTSFLLVKLKIITFLNKDLLAHEQIGASCCPPVLYRRPICIKNRENRKRH